MKKLTSVLILICLLFISGCSSLSAFFDDNDSSESTSRLFNESDSSVTMSIYPETEAYPFIGLFERPQYSVLTNRQKSMYIKMDNAIFAHKTGYIDLGDGSEGDVEIAFHALLKDRPEYFWVPLSYTVSSVDLARQIMFAETEDDWKYTLDERLSKEKEIKNVLSTFISKVPNNLSEYERELFAHDWLAEKLKYNYLAATYSSDECGDYSIEGAFLTEFSVCQGYAEAMQVLLYMLGINNTTVTGKTDGPHMWNIVNIDGDWYHLDVTSNDTGDDSLHFLFNVTTEYLTRSIAIHQLLDTEGTTSIFSTWYNLFLPICTATKENYYVKNSSYIASSDSAEATIVSQICNAVRNGCSMVEFSFSPDMYFYFGRTDVKKTLNLEGCIKSANAELESQQKIFLYKYGGLEDVSGFYISW